MIQNPFIDDWFSELVVLDKKIMKKANQSYLDYSSVHDSKPSIYMLIYSYLKTHVALAAIISSFTIGTAGVSAAELLSPQAYKPSTVISNLFKANKQPDKDPTKALKTDLNGIVIKGDQNQIDPYDNLPNPNRCDVTFKYPKKIGDQNIYYNSTFNTEYEHIDGLDDLKYDSNDIYYKVENNIQIYLLQFNCYNRKPGPNNPATTGIKSAKNMSKEELQKATGWLVTQADIKNIQSLVVDEPFRDTFGTEKITFEYKDKYYVISKFDQTGFKVKMDFTDFQIQFNSLITNPETSDTTDATVPDPTTPQSKWTTAVLDKYNLALSIKLADIKVNYNQFNNNKGLPPGINFDIPYKNQNISVSYFCPEDTSDSWNYNQKPAKSFAKELEFEEDSHVKKSTPNTATLPFSDASKTQIKQARELSTSNFDEYVNVNSKLFYYEFQNGNYCYLSVYSTTFQENELVEVIKKYVSLDLNSVVKITPNTNIKTV